MASVLATILADIFNANLIVTGRQEVIRAAVTSVVHDHLRGRSPDGVQGGHVPLVRNLSNG